ncbi:MAG: formylglycine-generating enzyme family protein [bacterium]
MCEWIDNAADYYGNSHFVVTSRHTGYRTSEGIELHADHLRADVLDLDEGQQKIFLRKWFAAVYGEAREDTDLSPAARLLEAETQAQDLATAVLNYLAKAENAGLRRMAGTPVLLQIMAILWKEYHHLPPARAALYEKCLDYLLDYRDRDREKEIIPLLPADDAKIVLRPLCLWMQETHKSDEATVKEIVSQIAGRLEEVRPGTKPRDFVKNLSDRSGILQEFGEGSYIFRHKSFREYLAATHLAEEVKSDPPRAGVLVENFHEGWWRETILFSLSLPKPVIFSDFFTCFLPHANNTPNALPLLELAIKEARQKSIEPFAQFALDPQLDWQKRYNALHCLRLISSEPAKKLVQRVWELEKHRYHENGGGRHLLQKSEEMLFEWKLRPPEPAPEHQTEVLAFNVLRQPVGLPPFELAQMPPPSWRNPLELDAEYILIRGGEYEFSVTKAKTAVPALYFAKYPVTNKLYRRFIDYLAGQATGENLQNLPLKQFIQSFTAWTKRIAGFGEHLGKEPKDWCENFRSRYDDDKRFNGDDQPVVGVRWFAAVAYCYWLSEIQKANGKEQRAEGMAQSEQEIYRLPTETEWEWAASGGKREYPWGDAVPDETRANYGGKVGHTTPVGAYPAGATPEVLMDMAGNVWEWMENRYKKDGNARALRGGSWVSSADDLRCAARSSGLPGGDWSVDGFRVVRAQSSFGSLKI